MTFLPNSKLKSQLDKPVRFARLPSHHAIKGLSWAQLSKESPWPKPRARKGSKGQGIRYERKVGSELMRRLGGIRSGQWIYYCDLARSGYAQPDHFRVGAHSVLVFECKLTQCRAGELQLQELYRPLLAHIFQKPVITVMACRNVVYPPEALISGPEELLESRDEETLFTWHWLGR